MLTRTRFHTLILILCIISSCQQKYQGQVADRVVNINPREIVEEIYLSEFVDSLEYIRLQTDSSCTMGWIYQIRIKDKYIYVEDLSQHILFVFDKQGNYVAKLDKKGQGPQEYLFLGRVIIDDGEEQVGMFTQTSRGYQYIKYSNLSFEFIEEKSMPEIRADQYVRQGDIFYFSTQQVFNRIDDKPTILGLIIVEEGEIVSTHFDRNIEMPNNYIYFSPHPESFTKNDKGEIFVSFLYDNTFYRLDGLDVKPEVTVCFGRHGINNSIGFRPLDRQHSYLREATGLASFPLLTINNSNVMAFSYYFKAHETNNPNDFFFLGNELYQYIEFKKSNQTFHAKKIKNDITELPDYMYIGSFHYHEIAHDAWHQNYLVNVIIPYEVIPDGEDSMAIDGLGEISINDNPIIVLMRLKDNL